MTRFKTVLIILVISLQMVSGCGTDKEERAVPPTEPPQEVNMKEKDEIFIGKDKVPAEVEKQSAGRTVRPAGEYFLYPSPDPVFLALPQAMVSGGSIAEVVEINGEWVRLRSGQDEGWLPVWYLEGADGPPVRDIEADYLVLKDGQPGLLYPDGPTTVELEKGKLLKPLKEWNDWYYVGIIVYDIPAVQCAWVPKNVLLKPGETEAGEGFLHEGTEVYGFDSFEKNGPVNPEKLTYTMTVSVFREKEGYIAVQAAGGWTAWTKKENLKFSYDK